MAVTLLYGCFQVELCVRDMDAATGFLTGVLGAETIEQDLAREIAELMPGSGYRVEHLACGQATFQVNQPPPPSYASGKLVHQGYLDRLGPCVTNLNFYVDDIVHARALLEELGAPAATEGPSTVARRLGDYGPDNTRPGGDDRPFLFMATRHLIGLDLEIMEPNFLRFGEQHVQRPCFVDPQANGVRLERLRIVVADASATYDNLLRIFTPGSRSKPYGIRDGALGRSFRIGLAGIELEYCEPRARPGPLADHFDELGPGVVSIEFTTDDPGSVAGRARRSGAQVVHEPDLLGGGTGHRWSQVASREVVGFDVVLRARPNDPFPGP
jgi:Glyoxalase/Bleomycin resistance protein/Dioxygenase superfamily